jgi:integrase
VGRVHTIPISDAVRNILIAQKGKNLEYVFSYRGRPIRNIDKSFRKMLEHAGISDYRWHDNRHTWASILIKNGVPLNELQEMGGRVRFPEGFCHNFVIVRKNESACKH